MAKEKHRNTINVQWVRFYEANVREQVSDMCRRNAVECLEGSALTWLNYKELGVGTNYGSLWLEGQLEPGTGYWHIRS